MENERGNVCNNLVKEQIRFTRINNMKTEKDAYILC